MNKEQRFLLISSKKAIAQDLLVGDVFSYLQSKFALDIDEVELIKLELTSRDKAERLIDILLAKKRGYYRHFYNSLKYAEYQHLAELLENAVDDETSSVSDDPSDASESGDLPDIDTILRTGGVPELPKIFINRTECVQALQEALYTLEEDIGWVVFHGMAGSGKTLLAADSLKNENLVHTCFPGGIFWVSIGKVDDAILLTKMQNLCHWLDSDGMYRTPKNLEESRDRLRILFSLEHPRSLLVLDDVWSDTVLKYFDVRARTLLLTRNPSISYSLRSEHVLKLHINESLTLQQGQQLLSIWTDTDIDKLPDEANGIINSCKGSPLAISMLGALLKSHKNRWCYYLKQLQEQKISKLKSKLAYEYSSLHDAFAISFDDLSKELKEHFEMLCVFGENIGMSVETLCVLWDCDEVEAEDMMDELIGRSLIFPRQQDQTLYFMHYIQLGFLKEKMDKEKRTKNFHTSLIERYISKFGHYNDIPDDGYFHWHAIWHLVQCSDTDMCIEMMLDLCWLCKCLDYTNPSSVILSFQLALGEAKRSGLEQSTVDQLTDLLHLISAHSHLFISNEPSTRIDLAQLALIQPTSENVFDLALHNLKSKSTCGTLYYKWLNRPQNLMEGLVLSIKFHEGQVNCCRFNHSLKQHNVVSCGGDKLAKIWDSRTGEVLMTLEGHEDDVTFCCFSHDDNKIITCANDNCIKVWSGITAAELLCLRGHSNYVLCCQCSIDDKYLVSASIDGSVKVWDLETGFLLFTLEEHEDVVNWCCFSADSTKIASSSNDQSLKIWDFESKECIGEWREDDFIPFCVFTPDDESVVYTTQQFIKMYHVEDEMILRTIECPCEVLSVSFSPDQKYLASAHVDMTARLYDLSNEVFVHQYTGHSSWVTSVTFCKANNNLAISSADGICTVWELREESYSNEKLSQVFDVSFNKATQPLVAVCSNKNQVKIFGKEELMKVSKTFEDKISACKFGDQNNLIAVGLENGNIEVLSIADLTCEMLCLRKHSKPVVSFQFGRADELLMAYDEDSISVWKILSGENLIYESWHTETILKCILYDNGRKLASCSYDGFYKIWDVENNKEIFSYQNDADSAMMSCAVTMDNSITSCSSADSICKIWSSNNELLHTVKDDDVIRTICFSPDKRYLATGSDNGSVKIWNTKSGKMKCECKGHVVWINDIKFNDKSSVIVTASENIKFFDNKGNKLQTIPLLGGYLKSVISSKDFSYCITVDNLGYLYILEKVSSLK